MAFAGPNALSTRNGRAVVEAANGPRPSRELRGLSIAQFVEVETFVRCA